MPACVVCASSRAPSLSNASGAGRRSVAYFGMYAAAVCVQVVCCVFDWTEKLPPPVAEAGATSCTCMRALSALAGVCRRFQTGAGAHRRLGAHFGMFCLLYTSPSPRDS